jgi:hypothetical protein
MENYGSSSEPYWKFKGGSSYVIENVENYIKMNEFFAKKCEMVVDEIRSKIEYDGEMSRVYILGWSIQDDEYMSEFERSQLEYEGDIVYPEPRLTIDGDLIRQEVMV